MDKTALIRFISFICLLALASGLNVPIDRNGPMTDPRFTGNQETPLYWRNEAKDELNKLLNQKPNVGVARNVIFFLGDGMGLPTITSARILKGQLKNTTGEEGRLVWDKFPHVALSKTFNQDHQTPDSAGTGTQYLCGVRSNLGMLGLEARVQRGDCDASKDAHLTSIYNWSLDEGKSVGIVTTTRVTHATPAAGYAHVAERNWEGDAKMTDIKGSGCKDIARQLVEDNPNLQVIMGGGRIFFQPHDVVDPEGRSISEDGRRDGKNLIEEWKREKEQRNVSHRYVWNAKEFQSVDPSETDYLLGLFEAEHMQYEIDRNDPMYEKAGEPSLAEMTKKAIQILQRNDKGFFLLVEGGRIDHGHHANNARRALYDTLALDAAVETAQTMTNENETLLVVTADHSHVFVMSGYPSRGNPILGLVDDMHGGYLTAEDDKTYTTLQYTNGPGARHPNRSDRANITEAETQLKNFTTQSTVPLRLETHGGEDVAIYARGPMSHLFTNVHEQHYIAHAMAYASCVGDYKKKTECAAAMETRAATSVVTNNAGTLGGNMVSVFVLKFLLILNAINL